MINTSSCSWVFIVLVHSLLLYVQIRLDYMKCSSSTCKQESINLITCMIFKCSHGLVIIIIGGIMSFLNYELHLWYSPLHQFLCQLYLIVCIWSVRCAMSVVMYQLHCLYSSSSSTNETATAQWRKSDGKLRNSDFLFRSITRRVQNRLAIP